MADETEVCSKVSESVKIAGFLDKKGSMLWKRYWFVLEERLLLYYRSQLEYLNLSPCRGSVNMALVSSVQPRRNSREPVIHIVSRSTTLILKARDREMQAKWLQSLLESMGRGPSPFRLSLDNLPAQIHSLPRCRHTGSLDVVWKQPSNGVATNTGNEDELSEPISSESRNSTLGRIRTALTRRSSSEGDSRAIRKRHRESFLKKFIGKSKNRMEKGVDEPESEEDPYYDTIGSNQTSLSALQEILPGGTLTELKDRLASMEKKKTEDPPELPPRLPSTSTLVQTDDDEASDDSDFLGHYQKIRKGTQVEVEAEVATTPVVTTVEPEPEPETDINALYSLPKAKSNISVFCTPSASKEFTEEPKNEHTRRKSSELTEKLYDMTKEGIEMLIKELKQIECERLKALQEEEHEKEDLQDIKIFSGSQESVGTIIESKSTSNETLVIEIKHEPVLEDDDKSVEVSEEPTSLRDEKLVQVEKGLTDLNVLLKKLAEITVGPLMMPEKVAQIRVDETVELEKCVQKEEPDYDVPRPHSTVASRSSLDADRLEATQFFSKVEEDSSSTSNESVEPDSLEAKREVQEVVVDDVLVA